MLFKKIEAVFYHILNLTKHMLRDFLNGLKNGSSYEANGEVILEIHDVLVDKIMAKVYGI